MAFSRKQAAAFLKRLNRELAHYQVLVDIESATRVPPAYAAAGLCVAYLMLVVFNVGAPLLTNLAGFLVPLHYSLAALLAPPARHVDVQWLTYWLVFAFLAVLEGAVSLVYWIPLYYTFKLALLLWLALPMFRGAELLFCSVIAPLLCRYYTHTGRRKAAQAAFRIMVLGG